MRSRRFGLALDHQLVPAGADLDVEEVFEDPQVLVVGAEKDVNALVGHRYRAKHGGGDTRCLLLACDDPLTVARTLGSVKAASAGGVPSTGAARPSDGAPDIRSTAAAVFGNAMTSRIDGSPASSATMRSRPSAMPPCGGVPYSSASMKNPNRSCASSSEMFSRRKICRCTSGSWIRMLPPPISLPLSTRS